MILQGRTVALPAEPLPTSGFEAHAAQTPDAVAVVWNGLRLTYEELNERANRFAHFLAARGHGRGGEGRHLPRLLGRPARDDPRHAQGGRGLRPTGPRLPGGQAPVVAGRDS